jgi:hypothetical protein
MVFSDTTNKLGVIQSCERYTGLSDGVISGDATLIKEFTAYANTAMRQAWHIIHEASGCWKFDDSNETDLPQATTALVSAQTKYALPSDTLTIQRVEIKDNSGEWFRLTPLIDAEIKGAVDELFSDDATPLYYKLMGDTIELFPASNYNSAGGLKVYYDRGMTSFVYTDTTKAPGFASEYHDFVPLFASLEWLVINMPGDARTAQIEKKYTQKTLDLKTFYNKRFPDKKKVLRPLYKSYK